jgi:hypothetical protein
VTWHLWLIVDILLTSFFQILISSYRLQHTTNCVFVNSLPSRVARIVCKKRLLHNKQAQQAWANIAAQNYANATRHGIHRAINNNPTFGCEIDAQYVQETVDLANAKGFLSKFHAESENTEFLENLRKQWGHPSNMTIADGNLVDCCQIGTKDKARVSTNGSDKNLASTLQGKGSDASVNGCLKTSMLNKKLFGHATRFGNAVVSLHSR